MAILSPLINPMFIYCKPQSANTDNLNRDTMLLNIPVYSHTDIVYKEWRTERSRKLHNEELHNWHSSPYKKTEMGIYFSMHGCATRI